MMDEVELLAGEHVNEACARIVAKAPAFAVFNDVRLEATIGMSAGDLVAHYHAECERRRLAYEATPQYAADRKAATERALVEERIRAEARAVIDRSGVRAAFPWTPGMSEISGFGGGYEEACRTMVYAGLAWFKDHPTATPVFGGLGSPKNDDAKSLETAILAAEPGCSGALFGATLNAILFVQKNGWSKYVEAMTARSSDR